MRPRSPQIVALGGGGFSMEKDSSLLDDYVLSLTRAARPRVCFLPTASGDADHYVVRFYRRFSADVRGEPRVAVSPRPGRGRRRGGPRRAPARPQDLIYVGGGNVVSMLGAWRAHGLDDVLRRAWREGVVLCGPSAGSLCWFAEALSAFHGAPLRRARARPAAVLQLRALRRRARSAAPSTTASSATACAPASPPTTAWRCTSAGTRLERVVSSRRDGRAYPRARPRRRRSIVRDACSRLDPTSALARPRLRRSRVEAGGAARRQSERLPRESRGRRPASQDASRD